MQTHQKVHDERTTVTADSSPKSIDGGYIAWFETLGKSDVSRVGGKNASLGEMVQRLGSQGVRVHEGFATTSDAYRVYVEANGIGGAIAARTVR